MRDLVMRVAEWTQLHSGTISLRVRKAGAGVTLDGVGLSRV